MLMMLRIRSVHGQLGESDTQLMRMMLPMVVLPPAVRCKQLPKLTLNPKKTLLNPKTLNPKH